MSVPAAAEEIFSLGPLPVTNALLNGWIAAALFVLAAFLLRRLKAVPAGFQNAAEAAVEAMLGFIDETTHDRGRSRKFLPIVGSIFLFVLVSNWIGLIPGTGSIGVWKTVHGAPELVPLFRPATSDLNLTIGLAVFAVAASNIIGVFTIGVFKHLGKFVQLAGIAKALRGFPAVRSLGAFGAACMALFVALIEFMVGLIEIVSEAAKMVSLSLRLFGNIFAGEVLLTVLYSLVAFGLPLPFIFLELIVGVIQALVFSMLTLVYLTIATEAPHGESAAAGAH